MRIRPWVKEPKAAEIATPARASLTMEPSLPRPKTYTAAAAIAAPITATTIYCQMPITPPMNTERTTATAAPALTPMRPGSASGLRVRDCMSEPATASAAPQVIPTIVRGIRCSKTIILVWGDAVPLKASRTAWREIELLEPKRSEAIMLAPSRAAKTMSQVIR